MLVKTAFVSGGVAHLHYKNSEENPGSRFHSLWLDISWLES